MVYWDSMSWINCPRHLLGIVDVHLSILDRYTGPIWLVFVCLAVSLGTGALAFYLTNGAMLLQQFRPAQLFGTLAMLSCLPAFLATSVVYLHRETLTLIDELSLEAEQSATNRLLYKVTHFTPWVVLGLVVCVTFGFYQNDQVLIAMLDGQPFLPLDLGTYLGNGMLWAFIGITMGWRIPVSFELLRYGRSLDVDLYSVRTSHPLANLAAKDVLIIAGAMTFMPLQSLDAEFRWVNYEAGVYVGVPSALLLLLVPLLGIRKNIAERKNARLQEIGEQIKSTDPSDLVKLELLSAHADRVQNMSSWPFNLRLAGKLIGYAVIAPLAWVGAALVENIVDNLAG